MSNSHDGRTIRAATPSDAALIAGIYSHYVLETVVTFAEEPVAAAEIARRIDEVRPASLPWLVAEEGSRVVGYAYATPWRSRIGLSRPRTRGAWERLKAVWSALTDFFGLDASMVQVQSVDRCWILGERAASRRQLERLADHLGPDQILLDKVRLASRVSCTAIARPLRGNPLMPPTDGGRWLLRLRG
jgi:Acetyltransferase (GNAT) domain